jgi:hypothetical protein
LDQLVRRAKPEFIIANNHATNNIKGWAVFFLSFVIRRFTSFFFLFLCVDVVLGIRLGFDCVICDAPH